MAVPSSALPRLVVESGVHCGAYCDIPMGVTSVGAAFDNSVSLSDQAAACAFALHRNENELILRAAEADIRIAGKVLAPGQTRKCRGGFPFQSGGVEFRLHVPDSPELAHTSTFRSHAVAYGGTFLAGAVAAGVLTAALSLHAAPGHYFPAQLAVSMESTGSESTGSIPAEPSANKRAYTSAAISAAKILSELREKLALAGMDMVTIKARPDGSLAAQGRITQTQAQAWGEIGRWFDVQAKGRYVLVDDLQIMPEAPPLEIEAVWSGANPYVVDSSGQKFFVGSILPSGWSIRSIDRGRVLIEHSGQMVAVRF